MSLLPCIDVLYGWLWVVTAVSGVTVGASLSLLSRRSEASHFVAMGVSVLVVSWAIDDGFTVMSLLSPTQHSSRDSFVVSCAGRGSRSIARQLQVCLGAVLSTTSHYGSFRVVFILRSFPLVLSPCEAPSVCPVSRCVASVSDCCARLL